MKRAALYLRVSTSDQTVENQRRELEAAAERHGWQVVQVYEDKGISGSTDKRPALDRLMKAVARKEVDVVMAWSVDRIGRSLQHLLSFLSELKAKQVDLYLDRQGLDTGTPAGKAMFQMLGVFAEFERAMIVERVMVGMARARAQGKHLGRPRIAEETVAVIRAELATGSSVRAAARAAGVGAATAQRVKVATNG